MARNEATATLANQEERFCCRDESQLYSLVNPSYKSTHSGFIELMSFILFFLLPAWIAFSAAIASSIR